MKIFTTILLLIASISCFSQETNKYTYCQLVGISGFFTTKVTVSIDFGQETSFWEDRRLKDEKGDLKKFNSMIDALNFMAADGWEHVQAYAITYGNTNVYHHLLRKKITEREIEMQKQRNYNKPQIPDSLNDGN